MAVERGGMTEKGWEKERVVGLVEIKEMATGMVCIRLVNRKKAEHLRLRLKVMSTSFTSATTSLSMLDRN